VAQVPKVYEGWRRDLTLDAAGSTWFLAPHKGVFWVINQSGATVSLVKAGKTLYTIPDQTFYKFNAEEQEQVGLSGGTAGTTITITDEADVKLIPQNKDVLGTVKVGDGTNTVPLSSTIPSTTAIGFNVRIVPTSSSQDMRVGLVGNPSVIAATLNAGNTLSVETQGTTNTLGNKGSAAMLYAQDANGFWQPVGGIAAGVVPASDINLPTAAAISDATANPTVTKIESFLVGFNGTTWDRLQVDASKNLKVAQQGIVTVSQNFLGVNDKPDVTVNHAGTLPVSIAATVTVSQNLLGANDKPDVSVNQTNPLKVKPLATLVEDDDFPPTSLVAGAAEAIKTTGTVTLAVGQRVFYNLSGEPGTVTGAGLFVYVAIKGATSNKYYAVCQAGSSVSGTFDVPTAEKLNIVARNSDATNAHVFSGHWTAMSP
jgi:hypothetical protein